MPDLPVGPVIRSITPQLTDQEVAAYDAPCSDPHVTMRVGENEIESVVTRRSAEELSLKKGDVVTAVVKATEVMISKG